MDSFGQTALAIGVVQFIGWFLLYLWTRNERKEN